MLLKDDYDYMTNIVEVKPCDNCNSESQSEEIVSMVIFQEHLIIATKHHLYEECANGGWREIKFREGS